MSARHVLVSIARAVLLGSVLVGLSTRARSEEPSLDDLAGSPARRELAPRRQRALDQVSRNGSATREARPVARARCRSACAVGRRPAAPRLGHLAPANGAAGAAPLGGGSSEGRCAGRRTRLPRRGRATGRRPRARARALHGGARAGLPRGFVVESARKAAYRCRPTALQGRQGGARLRARRSATLVASLRPPPAQRHARALAPRRLPRLRRPRPGTGRRPGRASPPRTRWRRRPPNR